MRQAHGAWPSMTSGTETLTATRTVHTEPNSEGPAWNECSRGCRPAAVATPGSLRRDRAGGEALREAPMSMKSEAAALQKAVGYSAVPLVRKPHCPWFLARPHDLWAWALSQVACKGAADAREWPGSIASGRPHTCRHGDTTSANGLPAV